jgi:hypothetical protein
VNVGSRLCCGTHRREPAQRLTLAPTSDLVMAADDVKVKDVKKEEVKTLTVRIQ